MFKISGLLSSNGSSCELETFIQQKEITLKFKSAIPVIASIAFAQSAFAQSNVSIYGLVDACIAVTHGITGAKYQLNSGCSLGSRLGFKGEEDLGGGMKANFILENGFNIDSGNIGQGGRFFGRKSVVGLRGPMGEIQLGRDYTPSFYLISPIDPFSLGMGTASSMVSTAARGTDTGRNDNSFIYTSPNFNGFSAKAQYSLGESTSTATRGSDAKGLMFSYRSGALLVGAAYNNQANAADTASDKVSTVGGSYDLGYAKPAFLYQSGKWEGTRLASAPSSATSAFSRNYQSYMIGVTVPFGFKGGNLIVSHKRYDDKTVSNFDAVQTTLGYKLALSKRTKVYTAYSALTNKNKSALAIVDATTTYGTTVANSKPSTFWSGIEHNF